MKNSRNFFDLIPGIKPIPKEEPKEILGFGYSESDEMNKDFGGWLDSDELNTDDRIGKYGIIENNGSLRYDTPEKRDENYVGWRDDISMCVFTFIIPALAMAPDGKLYKTNVVYTANKSFVFVGVDPRTGKFISNGPVNVPVMLGTSERPSGIYVPTDTTEPMKHVFNSFIDFYVRTRGIDPAQIPVIE